MTRKSPQKKDAKKGASGAGPDRKSERPGGAKRKVGKKPKGDGGPTGKGDGGPVRRAGGGAGPAQPPGALDRLERR